MTPITLPRAVVQQARDALIVATTYLHDDADIEFEQSAAAIAALDEALAQPAPTPELPPLPQSVGDAVDFMDGRAVGVDWTLQAPTGGASLYTADQMRTYARAALDLHAKRGSEAPLPDERAAFEDLLDAAEEWERFVDVDRAPMNLRKWLERAAIARRTTVPASAFDRVFAVMEASAARIIDLEDRHAALTEAARLGLEALKALRAYDGYETEYDGRMYTICPSCGKQDGEHAVGCEFKTADEAIDALSAALPAHQKEGGQRG